MTARRFKYNKFGLTENPIGHKVCLVLKNRQYLGDVISAEYNDVRGVLMLSVRHFNGDMWPFPVAALAVEVVG